MTLFAGIRKLARRMGLIDRHPRGGLDRDRTIYPKRSGGRVEKSPFKKSNQRQRKRRKFRNDPRWLDLVAALEGQGYSRGEARRRATAARGDTFEARFKSALRS